MFISCQRSFHALAILLTAVVMSACSPGGDNAPPGVTRLSVWAHAGQSAEREVLTAQAAAFNAAHDDVEVVLGFLPERTYNAQVQAAAVAGELPDVLELDGPYLANYVWQGHLQALDTLLSETLQADLLPSVVAQGRYQGALYGVGTFDSGLGLYGRRGALEAAGARLPAGPGAAWPVDAFETLLGRLAAADDDGAVLDLKLNYPDEWFPYAFSPLLQSAGGDLIDRGDRLAAEGTLNGPRSVSAMTHVQRWLREGLVDPNVDDAAFTGGRTVLSLAGHWEFERYHETFGDDLVLMPLPDLGFGTRTGQGSWVWGVTGRCGEPAAAVKWLEFLLQTENVLAMSAANGAVPATRSAIARSPRYQPGGPLHLFVVQLRDGYAVPRPQTPAYPVISSAFRRAFGHIRDGEDVQAALGRAAAIIDQDLRDNQGYPASAHQGE